MSNRNLENLKEKVRKLGFPDRVIEQIDDYAKTNSQNFHIYYSNQIEGDQLMYDLRFTKDADYTYQLKEYELTYKQINIPDLNIQGINTKKLDDKLREVDNWYDKILNDGLGGSMSKQEYERIADFINATNNDVYRLAETEKVESIARLLMYKYFPESEYDKVFPDYQEMQRQHSHKHTFPVSDDEALTVMKAYQFLKTQVNSAGEHYTSLVANNHVISDEAFDYINSELLKGNQWIAYNTASYFIEKSDVYCFDSKDEAIDFAEDNISEYDSYRVIKAASASEVRRQIQYGEHQLEVSAENTTEQQYTQSLLVTSKDVRYDETISKQILPFTQKTDVMNEKNFDYLKDQVKYTGFGDTLENDLKEKLQKGLPDFQIYHNTKFGNDAATATLHFKKSDQSDMYFFNKYDLTLKQENIPDMMKQTFFINKNNNITLKEAYNLMSGRAVNKDLTNKEGQIYSAWIQMDFKETDKNGNYQLKHYHSNYGFDLGKELAKHPIKELANEQDRTRLLESLQKGNRQSVTFMGDGNERKVFIEANPRFKSLNAYDSSMQRFHIQSQKERNAPKQSAKQEIKKESLKKGDDDGEISPKVSKKRTRNKKQSLS